MNRDIIDQALADPHLHHHYANSVYSVVSPVDISIVFAFYGTPVGTLNMPLPVAREMALDLAARLGRPESTQEDKAAYEPPVPTEVVETLDTQQASPLGIEITLTTETYLGGFRFDAGRYRIVRIADQEPGEVMF